MPTTRSRGRWIGCVQVSLSGLTVATVLGRTLREVAPAADSTWLETFSSVALGGPPVLFEGYAASHHRHLEIAAYSPAPNRFAMLFTDISRRKQQEALLAASNAP